MGEDLCEKIRKKTKSGEGVDGKFESYTAKYKARKTAGKFARQSSNSGTPDLQLTGDMLRDLQVRSATNESVKIGWSGPNAQKVKWNEDTGRAITKKEKPLSSELQKDATRQVKLMFGRSIKKAYGKTKTIKVQM